MESASAPQRDISGVIAPPPLIYLAGLAVGFGLEALLPGSSVPDALAWILGGVLLLAGLALLFTFERAFTREEDPREPMAPDDGDRHRRPIPAHPQPGLPRDGAGVHRDRPV